VHAIDLFEMQRAGSGMDATSTSLRKSKVHDVSTCACAYIECITVDVERLREVGISKTANSRLEDRPCKEIME
jgi:hypothetical protein